MLDYLNMEFGIVGRTTATRSEPNTSSEFSFWLSDKKEALDSVEIGNIVAAYSDSGDDITFGLVTDMRTYSDVEDYITDFLGHNPGEAGYNDLPQPQVLPEVTVVRCWIMRNISGKIRPPARSRVYFPSLLGIKYAYRIVDEYGDTPFGNTIPVGFFQNGDGTLMPVGIDEDFLVGPEGAHLNISGISGLASKTSFIMFLLRSLLESTDKKIGIVTFNVKGKDLLYLDQSNPEMDDWSREAYDKASISSSAFEQVRYFAPKDPNNPGSTCSRRNNAEPFILGLRSSHPNIPALFSPDDWNDKTEGVWNVIEEKVQDPVKNIQKYEDMLHWIHDKLNYANRNKYSSIEGHHIYTWQKVFKHLKRLPRAYQSIISRTGHGKDIPWDELKPGNIFVVDMEMLDQRAQSFVFGVSIDAIKFLLEMNKGLDGVVVFVDELGKFAPVSNSRAPLKRNLLEITARGRSMGLSLFGAQQFVSKVERELVNNCATQIFGRTEVTELLEANYSAFSEEIRSKLIKMSQGELVVRFARFPHPVFVKFPRPPCKVGS